jgi:hypothetical protein
VVDAEQKAKRLNGAQKVNGFPVAVCQIDAITLSQVYGRGRHRIRQKTAPNESFQATFSVEDIALSGTF